MSTHRPESSASVGSPVARAACRAFSNAFSTKVPAVSSISATPSSPCAMQSMPLPRNRSSNSANLPRLPLAITSFTMPPLPLQRLALGGQQLADAFFRQHQQGIHLVATEGVTFGGALQLDEAAAV